MWFQNNVICPSIDVIPIIMGITSMVIDIITLSKPIYKKNLAR